MLTEFKILNEKFLLLQPYFRERKYEELIAMSKDESRQYLQKRQENQSQYSQLIDEAHELLKKMEIESIVEYFDKACELLQVQIAMHMRLNFDRAYAQIMVRQIDEGKYYGYLLIPSLVRNLKEEAYPLIIRSLTSSNVSTQIAALSFVRSMKIQEARPILQSLTSSSNEEIANLATKILTMW